jgi:septum site-determining protein MinD
VTGRIITITSGKGGVGKTTVTANLSVALAAMGHRVTAIDTDIGLRNLDIVLGLENRIVYDLVDVAEGKCGLSQALIQDRRFPNLSVLPASQTVDKSAISARDLTLIAAELRSANDYVFVDSPAGIEHGFQNAIAAADDIIVVTTPELSAVRSADRVIGLMETSGKKPGRLIINRIRPALVKHGDMLATYDVIEFLAIDLLGVVPDDEAIIIGAHRGTPASADASSLAGKAFCNIARRIAGETVPFLPILEERAGLWHRLRASLTGRLRGRSDRLG